MILETKLSNLDNKPIKVNKKSPPRSIEEISIEKQEIEDYNKYVTLKFGKSLKNWKT